MDEKFAVRHPRSTRTMQIDAEKYFSVKKIILDCLRKNKRAAYADFLNNAKKTLGPRFEGSLAWYVEVVKLDLEARKTISRVPKTSPVLYFRT